MPNSLCLIFFFFLGGGVNSRCQDQAYVARKLEFILFMTVMTGMNLPSGSDPAQTDCMMLSHQILICLPSNTDVSNQS